MDQYDLIVRAREGDVRAFDELYRSLYAPVFRAAVQFLRSRDDAEDVTQTVFINFFKSLDRYERRGSMLAYLLVMTRNACIDHARVRRPDYDDEALLAVRSDEPTPEESAILSSDARMVVDALQRMSPGEADALRLKYLDGLETREIAQILDKSEEAVRQAVSRGVRSLRSLLEGVRPKL